MDKSWKHFQIQQNANINVNDIVQNYGTSEAALHTILDGSIITDLSHLALIRVSGDDAREFLQNQLSNDIQQINPQQHQLTAYCSAKGRMLAIFRAFEWQNALYLVTSKELSTALMQRLQMFVLRSKVILKEVSDSVARIGVSGETITSTLNTICQDLPIASDSAADHADCKILKIGENRYEIYARPEQLIPLWTSLSEHAKPAGHNAWPLLNIMNGIPSIYSATSEHFIPQMANLELINGVSFKKGCYPGQEVVARMQYLGKLKRRMYLAQVTTHKPINPGDITVYIDDNGVPHETGEVVDARPYDESCYAALIIQQISSANARLKLYDATGPALEIKPLPYNFG